MKVIKSLVVGTLLICITFAVSPKDASGTLFGLEGGPGLNMPLVSIDPETGARTLITNVSYQSYQASTFDPINQNYYFSYRATDDLYYLATFNTVTNVLSQIPTYGDYGLASIEHEYVPEPSTVLLLGFGFLILRKCSFVGCATYLHTRNDSMKEVEQKNKKQRELLIEAETVCVSRFIQTV